MIENRERFKVERNHQIVKKLDFTSIRNGKQELDYVRPAIKQKDNRHKAALYNYLNSFS